MISKKICGIIIKTLAVMRGILFMYDLRWKDKRKRFYDQKSRKILENLSKRKKHKIQNVHSKKKRYRRHDTKAPPVLSIFDETDTALRYFEKVIETIHQCGMRDEVFFDLSSIEKITPDAIMYLIAVIKNTRRVRTFQIKCIGNMPQNLNARRIIEQSGFFKFVSSVESGKVAADEHYMKISSGKQADGTLASSFCDFVQLACGKSSDFTKRLYPMIIELMTNTHQHAYHDLDNEKIMMENWYIFAQDTGDNIYFIFLDNGVGIPKTVHKKFRERIKDYIYKDDTIYLKSALQGEFRSETKLEHRGKGLPGIYEDACDSIIQNLSIISGKAKCVIKKDSNIVSDSLSKNFEGTLFSWTISKGGNLYDYS